MQKSYIGLASLGIADADFTGMTADQAIAYFINKMPLGSNLKVYMYAGENPVLTSILSAKITSDTGITSNEGVLSIARSMHSNLLNTPSKISFIVNGNAAITMSTLEFVAYYDNGLGIFKQVHQGIATQWVATNVTVEDSNNGFNLTIPNFVFSEGCNVTFKAPADSPSSQYLRVVTPDGIGYAIRTSSARNSAPPSGLLKADSYITVTLSKAVTVTVDGSAWPVAFHSGQPIYEEGTWTPAFRGLTTAGSPVYLERSGRYVRHGSKVDVYFYVALTSKGGMTGHIRIGGLPFTAIGVSGGGISGNVQGMNLSSGYVFAPFTAEFTDIILRKANSTGVTVIVDTEISDVFRCYSGHVSYWLQ